MTTPIGGRAGGGPARAMDPQCRPGTPLMGALANVRLKMTRQTMRFLGDAGAGSGGRPPSAPASGPAPAPVPASAAAPGPAPPAEGDGSLEGGAQNERTSTASSAPRMPSSSRRRQARCRVGRAGSGKWPARWTRRSDKCCIRVRAPRVSIVVQRGDHVDAVYPTLTVTSVTPTPKKVTTVGQDAGGPVSTTRTGLPQPPCGPPEPADSRVREPGVEPGTGAGSEADRKAAHKPSTRAGRKPEAGDASLARRASSESLNSYVRRKASAILHQVAKHMSWFESQNSGREAAGDQERLLRQVSRVAAYSAASRHLRQAAGLYIVASVSSRAARRGAVRYCKLNCPPRLLPQPPQPASAPPPPPRGLAARPSPGTSSPRFLKRSDPSRPVIGEDLAKAGGTVKKYHINDLPKDLLLDIFSRLDQRQLSLCVAPVCRAWRRLARSRQFWRELIFDAAFHQYSAQSVCNLLRATPGLWTLELIACRDVDLVLAEVCRSCRKLRSLVVDSCTVSVSGLAKESPGAEAGARGPLPALDAVLEQCVCLQYLIVAFTPHLYSSRFFSRLGRRCWSLHCFLVSADDADVREFCESLSVDAATAAGTGSGGATEALMSSLTGSWTRTVPPPASPASTASDSCHTAHPPRETSGLKRRVTAVRTRNHLLRVLALRPDAELRLLQWRLAHDDKHATLDYFGVEARLTFR